MLHGDYDNAEIHIRRCIRLREEHDQSDLNILAVLALVLRYRGKYDQAEEMNRRALEGREKVLGQDHPDTLNSVHDLASVLQYQGRYDQAEEMNRRALEGREKVPGQDHPDTLASASDLALTLQYQGKYEKAENINRTVLGREEKATGPFSRPDQRRQFGFVAAVPGEVPPSRGDESMDGRERRR